jgi:hypothetical protein
MRAMLLALVATAVVLVAPATAHAVPGLIVTETGGLTDAFEGGPSDSVTVELTEMPSDDVTVTLLPDAQVGVAPPVLVFTPFDWNIAQPVTVTATDDPVDEGPWHSATVQFSLSSNDLGYDMLSVPDLGVTVTDNDTADVLFTIGGGTTDVTENGSNDSIDVSLASEPTGDVTLMFGNGGQITSNPALVFTAADWWIPQTLAIDAVDDFVYEGAHADAVTATSISTDPYYNNFPVVPAPVAITDDDVAGVVITETAGATVSSEGGAGDSYTVALSSEPTSPVTINFTQDAQLLGAPPNLVFTDLDWSTPQFVVLTAFDDLVAEGMHFGSVTHTASSLDLYYDAIAVASVTMTITDNDLAGVTVTESGGGTAFDEAGGSDTWTVELDSQPTANVDVQVVNSSQSTSNLPSVTFTPGNWNVPQMVTGSAVDDAYVEGAHIAAVTHLSSSTDPLYDGLNAAPIVATVADNDTAGISMSFTDTGTSVVEGGASDTVSYVLTGQPSSNVTVNFDAGAQLSATPSSITFAPTDWNTPKVVVIAGLDDAIDEDDSHAGTVTGSIQSSEVPFANLTVPTVTATIADNDSSTLNVGLTTTPNGLVEGGKSGTVTIGLGSQPIGEVTVEITGDGQVTATPEFITIPAAQWQAGGSTKIAATDDKKVEGKHTGTFTFKITSTDPRYGQATIEAQTVDIVDNDKKDGGTVSVAPGGGTDNSDTGEEGGGGGKSDPPPSEDDSDGGSPSIPESSESEDEATAAASAAPTTEPPPPPPSKSSKPEPEKIEAEQAATAEPEPEPKKPEGPSWLERQLKKLANWIEETLLSSPESLAATIGTAALLSAAMAMIAGGNPGIGGGGAGRAAGGGRSSSSSAGNNAAQAKREAQQQKAQEKRAKAQEKAEVQRSKAAEKRAKAQAQAEQKKAKAEKKRAEAQAKRAA